MPFSIVKLALIHFESIRINAFMNVHLRVCTIKSIVFYWRIWVLFIIACGTVSHHYWNGVKGGGYKGILTFRWSHWVYGYVFLYGRCISHVIFAILSGNIWITLLNFHLS